MLPNFQIRAEKCFIELPDLATLTLNAEPDVHWTVFADFSLTSWSGDQNAPAIVENGMIRILLANVNFKQSHETILTSFQAFRTIVRTPRKRCRNPK